MTSCRCILQLLVPGCGCPFDISQCEWLLDVLALRSVQHGLGLDWKSLDAMCRDWLTNRDVMTPLPFGKTDQCRENFPIVYNTFRSSLLQQYALNTLQSTFGCEIAGSYAAALFVKQQTGTLSWMPGKINVWVQAGWDFQDVLACYTDVLTSVGVLYVGEDETRNETEASQNVLFSWCIDMAADVLRASRIESELASRLGYAEMVRMDLPRRVDQDYDEYSRIVKAVGFLVANWHTPGQQTQYTIRQAKMVRVITGDKTQWYRHLKTVHILQVSARDGSSHVEPVHSQFDLSCCSVSLRFSTELRPRFSFHADSARHLLNGTMELLPCSFCSCPIDQMRRIMKYCQRGFLLVPQE